MKLPNEIVELCDKVEDVVSGFTGVVIARTVWLNGCARIVVQPKVGKDGKMPETAVFDEPQLKIIKRANTPAKVRAQRAATGWPKDDVTAISRD